METLYTAVVTATSGRDGKIKSEDGTLELPLSVPKGLGGAGGTGTNPEQLFAAGYSACFASALKLVAAQKKIAVTSIEITARVVIGKAGKGFGLGVDLMGRLGGVTRDEAEKLMNGAHEVCPYSAATRGNVDVTLSVSAMPTS